MLKLKLKLGLKNNTHNEATFSRFFQLGPKNIQIISVTH